MLRPVQHCLMQSACRMLADSKTTSHDPVQVPDGINDLEATFTEPLAAACRILEQKVHPAIPRGDCMSAYETATLLSHIVPQGTIRVDI
jgi:hypothetical protein